MSSIPMFIEYSYVLNLKFKNVFKNVQQYLSANSKIDSHTPQRNKFEC